MFRFKPRACCADMLIGYDEDVGWGLRVYIPGRRDSAASLRRFLRGFEPLMILQKMQSIIWLQ